jgi:sensor histidine kinase YesM
MRNDKPLILNNAFRQQVFISDEEKARSKKFWCYSFCIYAGVEIFIIIIQYWITRSKCSYCVLPPPFYFVNWMQHVFFTGVLWWCLNGLYYLTRWKVIPLNIILFLANHFLWLGVIYAIFHSGQYWLTGEKTRIHSYRDIIYGSWSDIGKNTVKFSVFYLLKFYSGYRRTERQRIKLAVINKDMQLNLLKQQLSPHFYFNTLNNLYGLAMRNSVKLSAALHQLSNIMQYVIVDCNKPKVLLSQEVNFLQSYIALEKLRYEQDIVIGIEVKGDTADKTILPLLLIQFVENAFKHGMKEKSEKNWLKVLLLIEKSELLFKVENSYYETNASEGIGMNSVKHILDLQYEGKYDMEVLNGNNHFSVTLKLNLA